MMSGGNELGRVMICAVNVAHSPRASFALPTHSRALYSLEVRAAWDS